MRGYINFLRLATRDRDRARVRRPRSRPSRQAELERDFLDRPGRACQHRCHRRRRRRDPLHHPAGAPPTRTPVWDRCAPLTKLTPLQHAPLPVTWCELRCSAGQFIANVRSAAFLSDESAYQTRPLTGAEHIELERKRSRSARRSWQSLNLRPRTLEIVSCPSCGRGAGRCVQAG